MDVSNVSDFLIFSFERRGRIARMLRGAGCPAEHFRRAVRCGRRISRGAAAERCRRCDPTTGRVARPCAVLATESSRARSQDRAAADVPSVSRRAGGGGRGDKVALRFQTSLIDRKATVLFPSIFLKTEAYLLGASVDG